MIMFGASISLNRLRHLLPTATKIALAQTLLLPILDYADVAYLDLTKELLNKLERLQNLCIWFIFGLRLPTLACFSIQIGGSIDLGPSWKYQMRSEDNEQSNGINKRPFYDKLHDVADVEVTDEGTTTQSNKFYGKLHKNGNIILKSNKITQHDNDETTKASNIIYNDPYYVKDDKKIKDFTFHIYKQTVKVFDAIQRKTSDVVLRNKIDVMTKNYKEKFANYLRNTDNQRVKTNLGLKKVVLNTVDTSHRILQKLVNHLLLDLEKEGYLRSDVVSAGMIKREVEIGKKLEYIHVCEKFGICRNSAGFSEFTVDLLTEIIANRDDKAKQFADAITDVLKNKDLDLLMDYDDSLRFKRRLQLLDMTDPAMIRPLFLLLKNVVVNKNSPVTYAKGEALNRTLIFLELWDTIEKGLPPNEANRNVWQEIMADIKEWAAADHRDVRAVVQRLIDHIYQDGVARLESADKDKIKQLFKALCGRKETDAVDATP